MKKKVNMKELIAQNKKEILLNREEVDRIEEKIDEKHNKQLIVQK